MELHHLIGIIVLLLLAGAVMIAMGTFLEWNKSRKEKGFDPDRLIFLLSVFMGAVLISLSYIIQLYLVSKGDMLIYRARSTGTIELAET